MLKNLKQAYFLSDKYGLPELDVILMALNIRGIDYRPNLWKKPDSDVEEKMNRGRFKYLPFGEKEPFFFAGTISKDTPFLHNARYIFLNQEPIADAYMPENDTCDVTYYRRAGKAITMNSNSRSSCNGCEFCGTYNLDANDSGDLTTSESVKARMRALTDTNEDTDLSHIEDIGIVTGCFKDEYETVNYILMLRKTLRDYGFQGEIKYIGSQITSPKALDTLEKIKPFGMYLTVECFDRREQLMKPSKVKVSLEKGRQILKMAKKRGMETTFLYILGLDPIEKIKQEFPKYIPFLTRHPIVNLMQNYVPEHENLRDSEARSLDYYIKARLDIETTFAPTELRPRLWENYRAPWSTQYAGEKINGNRI
ncbi:MAG: hypothetical protein KKF46_04615 [Nanoarchaeota archaeon]|nr:hypothetical protein [Nanoarchaeota archaeon]MBU1321616.1 hypothetical protein [Nanoarchaeota archaeon]MBU1597989.1 hypothetical protein [Nanoarchaeota archaeon]MBU2440940.1 hypothetical protein [Nanoarchaeota archaeon]